MSAKPSADAQTSLRWVSRCKGTTFFSFLQDIVQKNAICVRKYKWRFYQNLNKTHFFYVGGVREFSWSSQGRLSVKFRKR